MKRSLLFIFLGFSLSTAAQLPCSDSLHRQFDFWLGEWEVFGKNNQKAGDSRISLILDSCIVLEEWTSASLFKGLRYAGKSFNTYNRVARQWQQTWVDNVGGSTAYLKGSYAEGEMVFMTDPFPFSKDTIASRRLTFHHLGTDLVRQHGEISKDGLKTWLTEYDLQYRRKKKQL
jgi:hypothetical protein